MNSYRPLILMLVLAALMLGAGFGCTRPSALPAPRIYASNPANDGDSSKPETKNVSTGAETSQEEELATAQDALDNNEPDSSAVAATHESHSAVKHAPEMTREQLLFFNSVDADDSASAVDDDIWRKLDLAHEYHSMGVIANREASWEEAQYYFEKGLKVLAILDVESDSHLTPEATRYNHVLDDIVSDYRVTLRSLGHLEGDVSTSVLMERFGRMTENMGHDAMVVITGEAPRKVTYDYPVVMNDRVEKSIIYFQTLAKEAFKKYLRRSKKYTPMMKRILRKHGLPEDLIYLSLVESGYNPHAYSWARAMGLWQFISSTGREYGLNRNWWYDERKDPVKATEAACRFLKRLYEEFGSWDLAMAAYNGGPGRVRRTIKKQKTIDFWKLRLKRQTMDYVPLIMAATIIAKDPAKYGFENIEHEPEVVWDEVEIDRCLELSVVAKVVGCKTQELRDLNPELLRKYTPPNTKSYSLKIPVGSKSNFMAAYAGMPSPKETSWVRHRIKRGEAISTIASRYGVSQYAILEANNLSRRSTIYAGKELIVPVPLDREYRKSSTKKSSEYKASKSIYTIRSGDSLWDIARAFGTTVDALRRLNYVGRGSRIYVGQKLKIPSSAKYLAKKNKSGPGLYAAQSKKKTSRSTKKKQTASASTKEYKVRSGDTIWDIARKHGTTTAALRKLNGLGRSNRIYPGQVLKVTGSDNYIVHRVKRGESLSRIARRYRTSVSKILASNNLVNPDMLSVGDKLRIYVK